MIRVQKRELCTEEEFKSQNGKLNWNSFVMIYWDP